MSAESEALSNHLRALLARAKADFLAVHHRPYRGVDDSDELMRLVDRASRNQLVPPAVDNARPSPDSDIRCPACSAHVAAPQRMSTDAAAGTAVAVTPISDKSTG